MVGWLGPGEGELHVVPPSRAATVRRNPSSNGVSSKSGSASRNRPTSNSRRLVPPDFGKFTTSNSTGESARNSSTIEPNVRLSPDAMLKTPVASEAASPTTAAATSSS